MNNLSLYTVSNQLPCARVKDINECIQSTAYLRIDKVNLLQSENLCSANMIVVNSQIYDWFNVDINGVLKLFIKHINFDYKRFLFFSAVLRSGVVIYTAVRAVYKRALKRLRSCTREEENWTIRGCVFYVPTPAPHLWADAVLDSKIFGNVKKSPL